MKWYIAVLPHEPGRYVGNARVCSSLYPTEEALRRNWDMEGAAVVEVDIPDSQHDGGANG